MAKTFDSIIIIPDEEMIAYWFMYGIYYGYPMCCIEWFIERTNLNPAKLTPHQRGFWDTPYGFIPCPTCATKLVAQGITYDASSLIVDRIHSDPFPLDDMD